MVSIILSVYNTHEHLSAAVESVLCQTCADWELILVDDGSTDGSEVICDRFAALDSRIRVIHQENRGISAARNTGLHAATGFYLQFLDSDDWLSPDALEVLLQTISASQTDMVIFDAQYEWCDHSMHERSSLVPGIYGPELVLEKLSVPSLPPYVWNKFCLRSLYDGVLFPEGEKWEDAATVFYPISRAVRIAVIDRPLYHYRQRDGSITKQAMQDNSIYKWRFLQYRKRYEFLCSHYPRIAPAASWSVMVNGMLYYSFCLSGKDHREERINVRRFLRSPEMGRGLSEPRRRLSWLFFCLLPGFTAALYRARAAWKKGKPRSPQP